MAAELARLGYDGPSWACWFFLRFAVTALGSVVGVLEHGTRCDGDWVAVAEQLSEPRTFAALAGAARFLRERLWPRADAAGVEAEAEEPAAASPRAGSAGHTPPSQVRVTGRGRLFRPTLSPREAAGLAGPALQGSLLLLDLEQTVFGLVNCCTKPPEAQGQASGASNQHAAASRRLAQRIDTALRESGLLEALLAAFLAAPLPPPVSPEATKLSHYTEYLVISENAFLLAADCLHRCLGRWLEDGAVRHHLTQPQALRLRRMALEQVAMWRPEPPAAAAGGTIAKPSGGGLSGPGPSADPGPAAHEAVATPAPAVGVGRLWPILQPRALRLSVGPVLQITEVLNLMVLCVMGGSYDVCAQGLAGPGGPDYDPAGLHLLLPDFLTAVEALAGAAEALGRRAEALAALGVPKGEPRPWLVEAVLCLQSIAIVRLKGMRETSKIAACLPSGLRLQGWLLRAVANRVVLAGCRWEHVAMPLSLMSLYEDHSFRTDVDASGLGVWGPLSPAQRAAAQEALHLSGWAPALDRALRWAAERGHLSLPDPAAVQRGVAAERFAGLTRYLLPATVAPSVRQWWQQEHERRRQASPGGGGPTGAEEDEAPPLRPWPAQEALGALVTLAKLARREAVRMADAAGEGDGSSAAVAPPQLLLGPKSPAFNIASSLLASQAIADAGWAALAELGAGADAAEAAALARSRRRLGEVVDWCGVAAIQLATALAPEAAAVALKAPRTSSGGAAGGWSPPPIEQTLQHATRLGELVCGFACRCSPAALEAAAPQRALAALDALAQAARPALEASADASGHVASVALNRQVTNAIFVLSSDQQLRHLVPGWYWPGPPLQGGGSRSTSAWSVGVLSLDGGRAVAAGAMPPKPVVVTESPAGAALANARWPDDLDRLGPLVMAAARRSAIERGLFGPGSRQRQWAAAFGDRGEGSGGGSSWPPAALRVCGNPRCDALRAGAECALPLKQCAGCRGVRYCCVGCQQAHWRGGHKAECGRVEVEAASWPDDGA